MFELFLPSGIIFICGKRDSRSDWNMCYSCTIFDYDIHAASCLVHRTMSFFYSFENWFAHHSQTNTKHKTEKQVSSLALANLEVAGFHLRWTNSDSLLIFFPFPAIKRHIKTRQGMTISHLITSVHVHKPLPPCPSQPDKNRDHISTDSNAWQILILWKNCIHLNAFMYIISKEEQHFIRIF